MEANDCTRDLVRPYYAEQGELVGFGGEFKRPSEDLCRVWAILTLRYGIGMTACTWLEKTLSTLLLSTAVTT